MKVEDLITLPPETKSAIESNPRLMEYLEEEIECAGSLEAAIYNCFSIEGNNVYDTDGKLLAVLEVK